MMLRFVFFLMLAAPLSAMEVIDLKIPDSDAIFKTEVAKTIQDRRTGLSYRKKLPEMSAMLFVYKQPQVVEMWMKDCSIPLDMVFMDDHGKILYIQENTTPFSLARITSPPHTKYVLEVNAGASRKYGIKVNKIISIKQ